MKNSPIFWGGRCGGDFTEKKQILVNSRCSCNSDIEVFEFVIGGYSKRVDSFISEHIIHQGTQSDPVSPTVCEVSHIHRLRNKKSLKTLILERTCSLFRSKFQGTKCDFKISQLCLLQSSSVTVFTPTGN